MFNFFSLTTPTLAFHARKKKRKRTQKETNREKQIYEKSYVKVTNFTFNYDELKINLNKNYI